jgi:excinuclease ABC subunit A
VSGGKVVATGSPEEIAASAQSYTGHFLKKILSSK